MSGECQLNAEPFYQCCCNCKLRLTDKKHCSVHGRSEGKCVCNQTKGYVCIAFSDEGIAHSEWPEHSCGCELYRPRQDRKVAIGEAEYNSWSLQ
jgi:hypothetical protein